MSSSESSSLDGEGPYDCFDYDIEDECFETASKDMEKGEPSYAVEDEFLDNIDAFAYTDEPLAHEAWVEEYVRRQEEHTREMNELNQRLHEENPVDSWCTCGCCNVENLVEANECRCCREIQNCVDALTVSTNNEQTCITNHPGFHAVCINRWSLELASQNFKTRSGQKYQQVQSKERFLRVVAYRQFTRLVHGYLQNKRIPLPACAYHCIRKAFDEKDGDFTGYEDLEEQS